MSLKDVTKLTRRLPWQVWAALAALEIFATAGRLKTGDAAWGIGNAALTVAATTAAVDSATARSANFSDSVDRWTHDRGRKRRHRLRWVWVGAAVMTLAFAIMAASTFRMSGGLLAAIVFSVMSAGFAVLAVSGWRARDSVE